MEGHGLSHGEQRALYAMEEVLRQEAAALDRQLRTMTPRMWHRLADPLCRPATQLVVLLGMGSVLLLVLGIRTSSIPVIWGFSACCTVTLLAAGRLTRRPRPGRPPKERPAG